MRLTMLWVVGIACAIGSLACKPAPPATPAEDNRLLDLVLTHKFDDGGFTVVSPDTDTGVTSMDPKEFAQTRKYVLENLKVPGVNLSGLLEQFASRNAKPAPLTLPSAPQKGYLIDAKGEYGKYFETNGGGWEQWHKEHPKAHGFTTVSLPVWDKASGTVLVYIGTQVGPLAGAGYLIAFRYDGTALKEIGRVMLWIS